MDPNTLAQVLIARGGYNPTDAANAARGPRAQQLAIEFGLAPKDFEQELSDAYGELAPYYTKILEESKGDLNKAMSRLTEDYSTGERRRLTDFNTAQDNLLLKKSQVQKQIVGNALSRNIYQKSLYDTSEKGGMGIVDQTQQEADKVLTGEQDQLAEQFNRGNEDSLRTKQRTEADIQENQKRYEADLEQKRRVEAANLANSRYERALRRFDSAIM